MQETRTRGRTTVSTPAIALKPGVRLRAAVRAAHAELDANADPWHVHQQLQGALAYTAAIGETAMVAAAAEAVRVASAYLLVGEVDGARGALADADRNLSFTLT